MSVVSIWGNVNYLVNILNSIMCDYFIHVGVILVQYCCCFAVIIKVIVSFGIMRLTTD